MKQIVGLLFGVVLFAAGLPARAEDAIEVFTDKGDTFIRAGSDRGLKVGASVIIVGEKIGDTDERRRIGKASVMEVWPTIARVSLDNASQAATGQKFARIPKSGPPAGASKAPNPASAPVEAKAGSAESGGGGAGPLKGHAAFAGVGPEISHKIVIYNDDSKPWSNCELRLPNNKRYVLQKLKAGDSESVMVFKFNQDGTAYDKPVDSVSVKCNEGSARFTFTM